jgi:hypothetical protein
MTEIDLTHTIRSLSLGPVTPVKSRLPYRQSVQDSEDQAAGIFSLYGGARDSWQSSAGGQDTPENAISQPAGHNGHSNGTTHATIDEEHGREGLEQEELESEPRSPVSWDGPTAALSNGKSIRLSGIPLAPAISVTADNTPERRSVADQSYMGSTRPSSISSPPRTSRLSLSPRPSTAARTPANASQVSIAASSQYPGEEDDAFLVRSTCECPDRVAGRCGILQRTSSS